jgi:hypothetical protein
MKSSINPESNNSENNRKAASDKTALTMGVAEVSFLEENEHDVHQAN